MKYFNDFIETLSNGYTSVLLSFLIGYIVGLSNFNNTLLGLLIGIVFATLAGIINLFIEIVLPKNFDVTVNVKFSFTLILIMVFFVVASSVSHKSKSFEFDI